MDELNRNIAENIILARVNTIDRAALINVVHAKRGAVQHGYARARIAKTYDQSTRVRIEATGASATPDRYAKLSGDAFYQLLGIAAHLALSQNQSPTKFFLKRGLGSFARSDRLVILRDHNIFGDRSGLINPLLADARNFLNLMEQAFENNPSIHDLIAINRITIERVGRAGQTRSLDEYLETPSGIIADTIRHLLISGQAPAQVVRQVHDFQLQQSQRLIEAKGDLLTVLKQIGSRVI